MTQDREVMVLKANGQREAFKPEKLRTSLLNSGATDKETEDVLNHILKELHDDMTTSEIYRHAFAVLEKEDKPIARSYSLRRSIMELGPSGFPFEDFVAEILRTKGFTCETRQTVLGACVPHEVDVVAYNDKKLIMAETKFHNELGTKSDLKVALYIKARFDDIRGNTFDYGGKNRKVDEGWLITNTKFSSTAIHYGECNNLVMIGWNYPDRGSLQDMIESETLHPITCLASLSSQEKRDLLASNVVLASSIHKDPQVLKEVLGKSFDAEPVLREIELLYR